MNIQKAVEFVEANGTTLEKHRLHFLLGKERNDEIPLQHLRNLQNEDGGFPCNNEKGRLTCVNDTNNSLHLMIELGLKESDVCKKTVEYLFKIQGEDGSWSENEAIKQYNPPFWDQPSDLKTAMWLTADITNFLIQLGYRNNPATQRAMSFLLKNRDKEGKFAGFLHSTWIAIGVFGQLEGRDSDTVKKALEVIEKNIEKLGDGVENFLWCLECLYVAGIPKQHSLVKRCIEELVNSQQENGAWKSGDGAEFSVPTTINALNVLKRYEVW